MAVAFACPGCSTPFNVTEEMAGKRAKCPKCLIVFTLPSAEPAPAAIAERVAGKAPVPAATTDLFKDSDRNDPDRKRSKRNSRDDDERDERDRDRDRDDLRPRRAKKGRSGGSMVPWILAVTGVAVLLLLICSGVIVAIVMVTMDRAPRSWPPWRATISHSAISRAIHREISRKWEISRSAPLAAL